jgi:formate dehydrogenase
MEGSQGDADLLYALAQVMADASFCGLGLAAPNPIRCIHKYFPHEVGEAPWPGDLPKPRNSPLTEQLPGGLKP